MSSHMKTKGDIAKKGVKPFGGKKAAKKSAADKPKGKKNCK